MSKANEERTKLLATFFNNTSVGVISAGVIGPAAAFVYQLPTAAEQGRIVTLGLFGFIIGICLHLTGRAVLGDLK